MAKTGLMYPVYAPITAETYGAVPTYGAGGVIGDGISADITLNYGDNPLYANNREVNNDKSFTDGSLKLGVDDYGASKELSTNVENALLGRAVGSGDDANISYVGGAPSAPFVGVGYYKTGKYRDNGGDMFEAVWIYKAQFGEPGESAKSKGKTIEWQTPEIEAKLYTIEGLPGNKNLMEIGHFDTEAEARTWLNTKAGITTTESSNE